MANASRPARGAWVEIAVPSWNLNPISTSRPARGAWVEISYLVAEPLALCVAPRKGRVG